MAKQHPILLYVGDKTAYENLNSTASAHAWMLTHAEDMRGALAQYVFFRPDMIIIEESDFAAEAIMHLCSVEAYPIVLLTDDHHPWLDQPVYSLPHDIDAFDLAQEIIKLLELDPMQAIG